MKVPTFFLALFTLLLMVFSCQKEEENEINCDGFLEENCFAAVMADGKTWTVKNLDIVPSGHEDQTWWYSNSQSGKTQLGRLYSWEAAKAACSALGGQWRLPKDTEWQALISAYSGTNTFQQLTIGGDSGFDAQFGGQRHADGTFTNLNTNGLYWTGTEQDEMNVTSYNFISGEHIHVSTLRSSVSTKDMGHSCRCIKN